MKSYIAELFRVEKDNRVFVARIMLSAPSRGKAVHQVQLWYWDQYRGAVGPAHEVLRVNDPHAEVRYGPDFNCGAKTNRLLPEPVIVQLLKEAKGELARDTRLWRPHHPPGSVRRVKRRRDFGRFILPNIRQMRNGVLYYRVTLVPQKTVRGRRCRKRRCRDIRLWTRSLSESVQEIKSRELYLLHLGRAGRVERRRSLAFLESRVKALAIAGTAE